MGTESVPNLIVGGVTKDHRGQVFHINPFQFKDVKRVYFIENITPGFLRGWNGHQFEKKYFFCVKGEFQVGVVKIDNWENPSHTLVPQQFVLNENNPQLLEVPCGYANIVINRTVESRLMVFFRYGFGKLIEGEDSLSHKLLGVRCVRDMIGPSWRFSVDK